MAGRTVVSVAHRLSSIAAADMIAVIHGGRVAELGTYDELIAQEGGIFHELVHRQIMSS